MIGVLAIGRLGNQIFQYLFALELANRLQSDFFIKDENHLHKFYVDKYFKLKRFSKTINKIRVMKYRRLPMIKISPNQSVNSNFDNCRNNYLYHGFYQSTEYFSNFRGSVNEIIQPKPKYLANFKARHPEFFNSKNIVLHVRGTDYNQISNYPLGGDYYSKALDTIAEISSYSIHLVTDDLAFAESILPANLNYTHHIGTEIEDFFKIMHADVAVIANSSFSWWAAFLNKKKDKKVLAPKRWLGSRKDPYPKGIFEHTGFYEL